jgi:chitinase
MRYFQAVAIVGLPVLILVLALTPQRSAAGPAVSINIDPPEATLHVGQARRFTAVVKGADSTGIRWTVEEKGGGSITEDGVYTAPQSVGIYHVVATSKASPSTRSVAKVTVVTEYDTQS